MSFNCCFKGKEKREKGADLFKLEFKGALNKSVPFCWEERISMVSNFGELQKTVSLIGAKLGAPKSMLLVRESSPEDGTPHVEFKSEGFEYVSSERGYEKGDRFI